MRFQLLAIFLTGLLLTACGGQSGGLAPSNDFIPPATEVPNISNIELNFKYAEHDISANSWEAFMDTSDPVENQVLANGWEIEVRYE